MSDNNNELTQEQIDNLLGHTNQNGRWCCPHCVEDVKIPGMIHVPVLEPRRVVCPKCGGTFAAWTEEIEIQHSALIKEAA